jgi:serine phosphatase RsbU (regulator of sigma subunit)
VFIPAAASGLQKEVQAEFERWRFAPGDVVALDQVRQEKSSRILYGPDAAARLAAVLAGDIDPEGPDAPLFVLTPLAAHGETLGVFVVNYQNSRPVATDPADLQSFFDEQLAILQGIAHQTAVAVENIRLLKVQKEEAYVSVALLQVAQAIVSTNDLDEMLATIVRITPILVGVKRSVIFLWDEPHSQFQLSQSYGLRRLSITRFSSPDFPLLEAVRQSDNLIAVPAPPDDPVSAGALVRWMQLAAPGPDAIEESLASRDSLLLLFPLSVKGYTLGALLVEEPEAIPLSGTQEGSSWRRLREKRIEITTGISQQAALAIQNERLQRETVVRERLEREMQLARGIQRAFLPHQIPHLPGWDLSVRWRTAREVGGDFYDLFQLPDGRLGVVIADVADKGMPAALFMTLVRTLVRAAVQIVATPAEVLQRVNDLLVPDAQDGMFITIVYAVLSPLDGSLAYANAGHNPPLLARVPGGAIERLEKGGMALGVLEGSPIVQRTVQLGPGDFLVLYTDGITEAFSPEGSMFGEDGLRAVIQPWAAAPEGAIRAAGTELEGAEEILESIDDAVNDFIEDSFLSDDLTMIVLRRMR